MMNLDLSSLAPPVLIRPAVPLTDEELIHFSEVNKPYRFERNKYGEIVMMTPIGGIGGTNEMRVSGALASWTDETGTGVSFSPNTGFNLPDGSCLSPDAAWVSLARWNALTPEEQASFPPLCPEFLIEVRSRSDSRRIVEEKMQLWMDNGAQLAWLVDPIDANVTIYVPGEAVRKLERPELVEAGEPVAGFVLRAERLWPALK
ncbi:Uma2 family endonuclease [Granulicella aggregans]|uniref:Uma2 family endonuclease n=1 Tax=Granulicella aggregans TaxID=474949 RepID=UPI0021E0A9F9|nr:Uma2 family endonuclease [Granulicella aggregans]